MFWGGNDDKKRREREEAERRQREDDRRAREARLAAQKKREEEQRRDEERRERTENDYRAMVDKLLDQQSGKTSGEGCEAFGLSSNFLFGSGPSPRGLGQKANSHPSESPATPGSPKQENPSSPKLLRGFRGW